ncbi:hypothetical protein QEG73_23075 [Chitinophagaceae bacterium 26-R-25]|nr:hypothetical protein [Chitinophagaceae bacterium 26-R-25]
MKQYYVLDCSAYMCYVEVRVNDVEVFALNVDGQMATDIPINLGILESGIQTIEVRGTPVSGKTELEPGSYIRYKVVEQDAGTEKFEVKKLFDNNYTSPVKKGVPLITNTSTFNATVPYKLDAWQNGINLKNEKNVKEKLVAEYNKIINLINAGSYEAFISKYGKREINNALAFYLTPQEAQERIARIVSDMKAGFKAMPLSKDVFVEYSASGKLACLKSSDKMSALRLENNETDEELILQISFYMPTGKAEFNLL